MPACKGRGKHAKPMNEYAHLSSAEVVQEGSAGVRTGRARAIDPVIIGERLRLARIAAKLTQQELAGDTYSKSYISAVERGKMTPSFQALRALAARLNRPLSFFFGEGEATLEALVRMMPDEEQQRREEARQMLGEAEGWILKGEPEKALEALNVAANEPPAGLPLYEQPRWYRMAGWASVRARKFPEAIGWLERGLELVESVLPQAPSAQRAWLGEMAERMRDLLGGCYYETGQPDKAREYHLRCLSAITDGIITDLELKLQVHKSLGNDNMALGRYDEAILYYKRACALVKDLNDPRQEGLALWGLGLAYKSSGDLFRAEKTFREALMIFERQDNMQFASALHAMLGQVLTRLQDYEKADRHLRLALETAERVGDAHVRRIALGNLAILRLEQGNPEEAIKAAQEGLGVVMENKDHRTEGQIYQTLAEAYEARQDVAAAEQAYQTALALLEQSQDGDLIGRARERYGQFLAAQGRFEEAYEQMGMAQALLARQTPAR